MNANFVILTPDGPFPVFACEMRPELFIATLIYYWQPSKDETEPGNPAPVKAEVHLEEGKTEAHALERLKAWCVNTFGEPCAIATA